MKVNIIIPFYKNYDTIVDLVRSIDDQDYKNYDVTIVVDGEDPKAKELLESEYFNKDGSQKTKFKLYLEYLKENKGASAARNYGAHISGENLESKNKDSVLFFIDADCRLYPGMLRECVNTLEDNDDVDFVYGNYRFENKYDFFSNGYDPKLLETMNYISTMSPIRRKSFNKIKGFRELDFFQDWDLFYRASREGMKGKYINEHIFTTQKPKEGNISGEMGMTLAEKCKKFRKLNGIADKKIVTTTFSAPLQAIQRSKMIDSDYVGMSKDSNRQVFPGNYLFDNWEATYMVGVFNHPIKALENHMSATVGKPIYHFIGSDVMQMYNQHSVAALTDFAEAFKKQKAVVFANSRRCLNELHKCGFTFASLLYTPIYEMDKYINKAPLPKDFTVAVYYSDSNNAHKLDGAGGMSNIPLIMDVARSLPNIKFKFFGGKVKYLPKDIEKEVSENIEFVGRIPEDEMVDFINSCSMVLRSTVHDGFPQLPIQFMLCGRQALVSCPDKEMRFSEKLIHEEIFDKYDEAKTDMINKILTMSEKPDYLVSQVEDIHKYYAELMSVENFKEVIHRCLD
jgi:hypothetical protein